MLAAKDLATLIIQAEDSLGEGACYNPEFAVVAIAVAELKIRVPLPREWIMIRVRGKFETDDLKGAEEALNQIPAEKVNAEIQLWKAKALLFRDKYIEAAEIFEVFQPPSASHDRRRRTEIRTARKLLHIWN